MEPVQSRFAGLHHLRHMWPTAANKELRSAALMAKVEMYATMWCPYCARARALLEKKGVRFTEFDIDDEPQRRDEMIRRAGGRTSVPQIFIDGEHIGGSDEMAALDRAGKLDPKLGIAA